MVTTVFGVGTADGFNECGLGSHLLYLKAADFGPRDTRRPGLQATLWAQFVLDNAATVKEALAGLEGVQLVTADVRGSQVTVHLAIEDASGDSAIIEYIGGKPVTHHGPEHRIMTNDPIYDEQLALLKKAGFFQAEQPHASARQRQSHRPFSACRLLCRDAARAEERT